MASKRLMDEGRRMRDDELFRKAKKFLVGGVNSPVRSFHAVGGVPLLIKKGKGSKVYDYQGNQYIDYVLAFGAAILGHAYPGLVRPVAKALVRGFGFGTTHQSEITLAATIQQAIPFIEKIRFVNSGTEAVMGAVRLSRGYTGRDYILKFEHSYHGHADYLLARGGSGLATLRMPSSAGVPLDFIKYTLVTRFGDRHAVQRIFLKYGKRIAAVLVEPVGGNYGVIPPDVDFLEALRAITKAYDSLLIFDEVITGFRFHAGAASTLFGIEPDLITLGKIIGGGLPIGAFGGREKIMKHLAPSGDVYQASTFAGNLIVMQAGLSTIKVLAAAKTEYVRIRELTKYLGASLECEAKRNSIAVQVSVWGSMLSIKFREKGFFKKFYRVMLKRGVYFAPSEFEANFLSFAHTYRDIVKTIGVAQEAFAKL